MEALYQCRTDTVTNQRGRKQSPPQRRPRNETGMGMGRLVV